MTEIYLVTLSCDWDGFVCGSEWPLDAGGTVDMPLFVSSNLEKIQAFANKINKEFEDVEKNEKLIAINKQIQQLSPMQYNYLRTAEEEYREKKKDLQMIILNNHNYKSIFEKAQYYITESFHHLWTLKVEFNKIPVKN